MHSRTVSGAGRFWAPYEVFCSLECDLSYSLRFAPHHVEHLVGMSRTLQADPDQPSPPPPPPKGPFSTEDINNLCVRCG
jgi:hypothetical protein